VLMSRILFFLFTIKRRVEQLLMFPFIIYGRYKARGELLSKEFDLFFFIPTYAIGGAEIVNADIISSFPDKKICIFFTKKSENDKMLGHFQLPYTELHDISRWADDKKRYWQSFIRRGICSKLINSQKNKPVVFNGQCNFAYKLSPWIRKDIRQVELIHMCVAPFNLITIPFVPFYQARIMITKNVVAKFKALYNKLGVPEKYTGRIRLINNKIDLPTEKPVASIKAGVLKIFYAGRGGPQKRIGLMLKIALELLRSGAPVEFHYAGDFRNELPQTLPDGINYHGILRREEMGNFIADKDIILMTSLFEGFPIIIMESMSRGVVPVTTAVDGICDHITSGYNGLLIHEKDETKIVAAGVKYLTDLCNDRALLKDLSGHAMDYAFDNFEASAFTRNYRQVLINE
jgi:glycosyltransferase involved in cell wall biosynthesis